MGMQVKTGSKLIHAVHSTLSRRPRLRLRLLNSVAMKPTPVDIAYLYEAFCELTDSLPDSCDAQPQAGFDGEDVRQMIDNMSQLAGVMRMIEQADDPATAQDQEHRDIHTLCEYGLQLLTSLSGTAAALGLEDHAQGLENLCLPTAVWGARHGGEIRALRPVVNAIAFFANNSDDPEFMAQLLGLSNEVFEAVTPRIAEDPDHEDPSRPWRLLLLNRAIIATRSRQPTLMEPVFDSLVELLPEDAQEFFSEGMEQMDIIDYPQAVRDIMSRYYLLYRTPHTLH